MSGTIFYNHRMQLPKKSDFLLPTHLTKKEFSKLKGQFNEIVQLGFGLEYKSRWDIWMSIREFVQNALDITTEMHRKKPRSNFDQVQLKYDAASQIGYIIDSGTGIKFRNMFLAERKGASSWENQCLRGRFGEGMKYALLPLLREGKQILIRTVGNDYFFSAVELGSDDDTFNIIHMFQKKNNVKSGTCVAIKGVDPNQYRDRFVPFLESDDPKSILLTRRDGPMDCQVRQVLDRPGHIYVRDIFVMETQSYFGYNFWFQNPAKMLDPDRTALVERRGNDDDDNYYNNTPTNLEFEKLLKKVTTSEGRKFWKALFERMYYEPSKRVLEGSLEWENLNGVEFAEITKLEATALFEILTEITETSKFSWSDNYYEGKILEHLGYLDLKGKLPFLRVLESYDLVKSPSTIRELQDLNDKIILILPSDVDPTKSVNSRLLHKHFVELHRWLNKLANKVLKSFDIDKLCRVNFYTGDFQEDGGNLSGFHRDGNIYLQMNLFFGGLEDLEEFTATFLHELAHAACHGCDDLTEDFEQSLAQVGIMFAPFHAFVKKIDKLFWKMTLSSSKALLQTVIWEKAQERQNIPFEEQLELVDRYYKTQKLRIMERRVRRFDRKKYKKDQKRKGLRNQLALANYINERFLKNRQKARPNPITTPYIDYAFRRQPTVDSFFLVRLHKLYRQIVKWLNSYGLGAHGFTVIEHRNFRKKVAAQVGEKKAAALLPPGLVGGLLISCRDYDNLCNIIKGEMEDSVGLKQFKHRWYRDDKSAAKKMKMVKEELRIELEDLISDSGFEILPKLPFTFRPNDPNHFKAKEYIAYPIYPST